MKAAARPVRTSWLAAEVALVTAAYIAVAHLAVASVDAAPALPDYLSAREAAVGGVFLVGAIAQLLFVIAAAAVSMPGFREAIRSSWRAAPGEAWFIALAAGAIQCATIALFFIPEPAQIFELSARNGLLSVLAVTDGWSQEVVFRGYVLLRLAKAGLPVWLQVALSGAAFAAIHVGYIGSDELGVIWPRVGTATLGGVLALSVIRGKGSLLPAVTAHALVILIVQPWLALAT